MRIKGARAAALWRCYLKIKRYETALAIIYSRTTDDWVKEKIKAELLGTHDDKIFVSKMRPRNALRSQVAKQLERDAAC